MIKNNSRLEPAQIITDAKQIDKILEQLKKGREQYHKLVNRLLPLSIICFLPCLIIRDVYANVLSLVLVTACFVYWYRKLKTILLPPCPYCGTKDCLLSPGAKNPYLMTHCRECHAILIM
jgi:hypothetical protein